MVFVVILRLNADLVRHTAAKPHSAEFNNVTRISMAYQTLDYLRDLTSSEMTAARTLTFTSFPFGKWDRIAEVYGSDAYALLHHIYKFTATAGATYDITSTSYFDPFLLRISDLYGNVIVANDESDDGAGLRASGVVYDQDKLFDWVAPYTGTYYVSASWNQGSYYKFYGLQVLEDLDTVKGPAAKDLVYVFKSEKTGLGISTASSSYFYTVKPDEAANVRSQTTWPWVEKVATFEAAHSEPAQATPVFRFWSDKNQSHFFTVSAAEKNQIVQWSSTGLNGYDWRYEGEGFKVYTSSAPTDSVGKSAIPVYRLFLADKDFNASNGSASGHYYTADLVEYNSMVKLVGVSGEGVAFYGEVPGA